MAVTVHVLLGADPGLRWLPMPMTSEASEASELLTPGATGQHLAAKLLAGADVGFTPHGAGSGRVRPGPRGRFAGAGARRSG